MPTMRMSILNVTEDVNHSTEGGLFRLKDGPIERTIHPATVQSLIDAGVLHKDMSGACRLAQ